MITYDTIIVGSGISGLYCNYKLYSSNQNILIIEGSDKSGGRIQSINKKFTNNNKIIEAGAHRISTNHTLMLRLIDELKLKHNLIDSYNTKKSETLKKLIKCAKKFDKNELINNTLKSLILKINNKNINLDKIYSEFGYNSIIEDSNAFNAINLLENYKTKFFKMKTGLSSIITKLEKKATIKYNTILKNIEYQEPIFKLVTNNGDIFTKNIVIAIPSEQINKIPFLKKIRIMNNKKAHGLTSLTNDNNYIRIYVSFKKKDGTFWYDGIIDEIFIHSVHAFRII